MIEYKSAYKAKTQLFELIQMQLNVEKAIKQFYTTGDTETAELLSTRYESMNEQIYKAAQSYVALMECG